MPAKRTHYDEELREGAVRVVTENGKSIAQVARDMVIKETTLHNWVAKDRRAHEGDESLSQDDADELKRLRAENAELRTERDVLIGDVRARVRASPR